MIEDAVKISIPDNKGNKPAPGLEKLPTPIFRASKMMNRLNVRREIALLSILFIYCCSMKIRHIREKYKILKAFYIIVSGVSSRKLFHIFLFVIFCFFTGRFGPRSKMVIVLFPIRLNDYFSSPKRIRNTVLAW